MSRDLRAELRERLTRLAAGGLARELALPDEEREDFASNDYLGLARDPRVIEAAREATRQHGAGARASRLLGGGASCDREAELALAAWLGLDDALLFATGFQANLGALGALLQPGDALLSDELNHASLIDAARLTKARKLVYAHDDLEQLEERLIETRGACRRWVVAEGVFSMDGDIASLVEISMLCARHDAWLVVDEAHSVGVLGPEGAGAWAAACEAGADESRLAALVVPCGKALGAQGGFVAGCSELRELLVATARSFVFSTGIAPAVSGALTETILLAREATDQRAHLRLLAGVFAEELGQEASPAAIVPVLIGDNARALELAQSVRDEGFEVRAVRPPTVPAGTARLRIVLHAGNSIQSARRLAQLLAPHVDVRAKSSSRDRRALVVVGTDTDIGKTVVSALLVRAAARAGAVSYWKPAQTGDDSDTETVRELSAGTCAAFEVPCYAFALPASPHEAAADEDAAIDVQEIGARFAELESQVPGELIVELAGGLLVPYTDDETQADLLAQLRPRIVLVARSGLGTLNHTLLTLEAMRARRLEPEALILVGNEHPSNRETLRRFGRMPRIFEVPRFAALTPLALDEWLDSNPLGALFDR